MYAFELGVKFFKLRKNSRYFDIGVDRKYKELWLSLWFFVLILYITTGNDVE